MSDVDSNGVDVLDRFRAYSERFRAPSFLCISRNYYEKIARMNLDKKESCVIVPSQRFRGAIGSAEDF